MTIQTVTALTMTLGVSRAQADHITKYDLDIKYDFDLDEEKREMTFKGAGCGVKAKQFEKLISKI